MKATLEGEPDLGLKLVRASKKIGPSEQKAFGGTVARVRGQIPPKIYVATFRLSYQDASGRHDLEAVFELSFDLVKRIALEPTSVLLDGEPHYQHPAGTTA